MTTPRLVLCLSVSVIFTSFYFAVLVVSSVFLPVSSVVGHLNELNLAIAILPVTRNSVWTQ